MTIKTSLSRSAFPFAVAVCAVLGITACGSGERHAITPTTTATYHPTAGRTANASTPGSKFTPDPFWVTPSGQVYPQGQPSDDRGPREFAMGTATLDASGLPVAYTAAKGDVFSVLDLRFGMQYSMLEGMNCLRRDPDAQTLYIGDIVNLDPHTAISVGTQNGHVFTPTQEQRDRCLEYLPPQH